MPRRDTTLSLTGSSLRTFGKQAIDIRTIALDGEPISASNAVGREFVWKGVIYGLPIIGWLLVALAAIRVHGNRPAFHHAARETLVVDA